MVERYLIPPGLRCPNKGDDERLAFSCFGLESNYLYWDGESFSAHDTPGFGNIWCWLSIAEHLRTLFAHIVV